MPKIRNSRYFKGPGRIWRKQDFPQIADGGRHKLCVLSPWQALRLYLVELSVSMFVL